MSDGIETRVGSKLINHFGVFRGGLVFVALAVLIGCAKPIDREEVPTPTTSGEVASPAPTAPATPTVVPSSPADPHRYSIPHTDSHHVTHRKSFHSPHRHTSRAGDRHRPPGGPRPRRPRHHLQLEPRYAFLPPRRCRLPARRRYRRWVWTCAVPPTGAPYPAMPS